MSDQEEAPAVQEKQDDGMSIDILLPKISREIGAIKKDRKASNYSYRGIDDALNYVGPALLKFGCRMSVEYSDHKVDSVEKTTSRGNVIREYHATISLRATFHAPDGSTSTSVTVGEGIDQMGQDKASSKAMSNALKYALFFSLMIPVDPGELADTDEPALESVGDTAVVAQTRKAIAAAKDIPSIKRFRDRLDANKSIGEEDRAVIVSIIDAREEQIIEAAK